MDLIIIFLAENGNSKKKVLGPLHTDPLIRPKINIFNGLFPGVRGT